MKTPTRRSATLALSILLVSLFLFVGWASAGVSVGVTPTAFAYLPAVFKLYPTPTFTPTPTATPTSIPSGGPVVGELVREDPNKPTYATNIEDIWFFDLIHNVSGGTVYFGVLGVNVDGPAPYFKTLWDGAGAPGGVLPINAGCWGPNGIPCAPNADAGRQRASLRVTAPGQYTLTLYICYSGFNACLQPGGNWQPLASVQITAIDWTPQAPSTTRTELRPATGCQLITADAARVYLSCPPSEK
jgi:hypothetical protein